MPRNIGSNPSDFDRGRFVSAVGITERPTEYRASGNPTAFSVSLPSSDRYEAWITFTAGADFTPSFPASLKWIGDKLTECTSGKTYEISIKDGVAIACEVGDGT